jgi:hypothetical protein
MSLPQPRRKSVWWLSFTALTAMLLGALGLHLISLSNRKMPLTWHESLATVLPSSNANWDTRDLPLADTESLKRLGESIL